MFFLSSMRKSKLVFLVISIIYPAVSLAENVYLDGILDDAIWKNIPRHSTNFQVVPQTFLKNDDNFFYQVYPTQQGLYLAFSARVSGVLRLRTQENDTLFSNDNVQIMLDMNNTEQFSYVFAVNHQGYTYDGIYKQNKELDLDWSSDWKYATNRTASDWSAEIYIPWSVMTFGLKNENTYGLSITRYDEATNTTFSSIPANASMNSFLANFKKETVTVITESNLDIFPYVSINKNIENSRSSQDVGVEIFWNTSNNHKFSATLNPDFAQVEANELVVNFSAIENFFSERRPFFNENQNIFNVNGPENLRVVHTPRIGGESFYEQDYQRELNSAFKYTFGNQTFDLGLLSAFESTSAGKKGRDFWSLRGQYHVGANKLGLSVNYVDTPSINRKAAVFATDFTLALSENTEVFAGLVKTETEQNLQMVNDIGWWLYGSTELFQRHIHEVSIFSYGNDLQLNDIGFVRQVNRKQFEYEYTYQIPDLNFLNIRDIAFSLETEVKTNFQNESLPKAIDTGIELVTESGYEIQLNIEYGSSGVDDLITRGNGSVWFPSYYIAEFEVETPQYDWGSLSFVAERGTEGFSGDFYSVESQLERQFSDSLLASFTATQYNSESWFDWDEDNLVNEYHFTEQGIALSIDYQIADNQELRFKFESVIGKARQLGQYEVDHSGRLAKLEDLEDFSFAESAFQMRYKYSLSNVTAFYLSYGFGGEFEDDIAKFGKLNLYRRSIAFKYAHNVFAKIRIKL
ncbi:hypothetical protein D210916BOD24_30350 [Alteromonas sp. D210916BOD_24]|uniref:DUF5916 domain-containing protein n=1 Tax=Alteromonas sp. D210916BOD_24 TaxID=3157618 RepID=UPI00399CB617